MLFKSYFQFTKSQRSGIIILVALCAIFQCFYFFIDFNTEKIVSKEKSNWLAYQSDIDSLKQLKRDYIPKIFPYNPNFITDFKGYKLGMSVAEIDRLLNFRKTNRYVNSIQDFQNVTKVSDSLLNSMSPNFKFPDWVNNKKEYKSNYVPFEKKKVKIIILDINLATKEDLIKVYGVGPAISERILKHKELLGGYVSMEQMSDVWGLSPEVIAKLNENFKVSVIPKLKKVDINNASIKELMLFPYFKFALAKAIVTYRSMHGDFKENADLTKINGFPAEKLSIIGLYLYF